MFHIIFKEETLQLPQAISRGACEKGRWGYPDVPVVMGSTCVGGVVERPSMREPQRGRTSWGRRRPPGGCSSGSRYLLTLIPDLNPKTIHWQNHPLTIRVVSQKTDGDRDSRRDSTSVICRVADPVHFWPDPDPANQNFKNWIRILLALTKNQFKHLHFFHIKHISSDIFEWWLFLSEKMEKFTWKCVKALLWK